MAERPDVRARDIDRALTATTLDTAYADGQLTYDEHRLRTERARVAVTLSDLRRLASDLQQDVDLPEPPPRKAARPKYRVALAVVLLALVLLATGVVVFLATRDTQEQEDALATPRTALQGDVAPIVARPFVLDTAAGLDDFRARYVDRFGSDRVLEVYIDVGDARADVYRPALDGRRERVFVSGGFQVSRETYPPEETEVPFDWSLVDSAAVAGLMAAAPDAVGVPDAEVETVMITNDRAVPEVAVTAYDADRRGGRVVADFAGNIVSVSPYTP